MRKTFVIIIFILLVGAVFWYVNTHGPSSTNVPEGTATSTPPVLFSRDGNMVMNNPGLKPDTWYLVYDEPGAPGKSVELDLSAVTYPAGAFNVGDRVQIEGTREDDVVHVTNISMAGSSSPQY